MAKVYIRVEDHGEYRNVTTVDSDGNYCQRNVYGEHDEHLISEVRATLTAMGWASLAEFLKGRKRFTAAHNAER